MARFRTSARTVDMLGRQQIAGVPTAISELFKNAHDAYATEVSADLIRRHSLLYIRDNGRGMSSTEFQHRWLTLGTESKLQPLATPQGMQKRPMLGEKGIGRLAIALLGAQVLVLTRPRAGFVGGELTVALINWGMFELPRHLARRRRSTRPNAAAWGATRSRCTIHARWTLHGEPRQIAIRRRS